MDAALTDLPLLATLAALGLTAGALTTLSGMGGGLVLVFALSLVLGPRPALVVSAAALLVGNLHRVWLYRGDLDRAVARRLLFGLVPGTLLGAVLTAGLSDGAIRVIMLVAAAGALARAASGARWSLPAASVAPAGGAVGFLAATTGGAAALLGPLLLSTGLSGRRYLAVVGVGASAMHVVRVGGYGAVGMWHPSYLGLAAGVAVAILAGNLVGDRLRDVVPARVGGALEVVTPVVCAGLAVAGLG